MFLPYALVLHDTEKARVCYVDLVHLDAQTRIQNMEAKICDNRKKLGLTQLIEEVGSLVDNVESSHTRDTRYTQTLGLSACEGFFYGKLLSL